MDVEAAAVDKAAAAVDVEAAAVDVEAAVDVAQDRGVSGRGHTMSRTSSGQYSAIWLCRYHCLSSESPEGRTTGGRFRVMPTVVGGGRSRPPQKSSRPSLALARPTF